MKEFLLSKNWIDEKKFY